MDVADAAPAQVGGTTMVNRMAQAPVFVRGHGQDAAKGAEPIVGPRRLEE
jgi:hypothetical protein